MERRTFFIIAGLVMLIIFACLIYFYIGLPMPAPIINNSGSRVGL